MTAHFGAMFKTYELWTEDADGVRRFRPVTCRTEDEAMAAARRLIADLDVDQVEVSHFGAHLFTVSA